MIPNLFIVGAPRCGTTALHLYLETHPRILMSKPKEPHYFGSDLKLMRRYEDREAYLRLFESPRDLQHAGEASVLYLYSKTAPAEILGMSPDAKVIIMLRDPLEMIPSLHAHTQLANYEDIPDLEEAVAAEEDRREGRRIPPTCLAPITLQYTSLARYAEHVVRYREAFGPDRVLCILYDDLRAEPQKAYEQTLAFLGLDSARPPTFKVYNAGRRWRSPLAGHLLVSGYRRVSGVGSKVPTKALRTAVMAMVGVLFALPLRLNLRRAPTLPPQRRLRGALREQLRDDVGRLAEILGRDLSGWLDAEA
jgi:hypothetical protein